MLANPPRKKQMPLQGPVLVAATLEAALGLVLCLPLPAGVVRGLVSLSEAIPEGSAVTTVHRCALTVVAALLLEAIWDLSSVTDNALEAGRYHSAVATVYLTAFTLFMTIMVKRLFSLTVASMRAELDKDMMAKQAKNQAEQADMVARMLAAEDKPQAGAGGGAGGAESAKKAAAEPTTPREAVPSAEAQAALKKQTEGQAKEYARVVGELSLKESLLEKAKAQVAALQASNSDLEQKCADFDMLFGDAPKKQN